MDFRFSYRSLGFLWHELDGVCLGKRVDMSGRFGKWIVMLALMANGASAQEIDNTSSFRDVKSDKYIRITGDDDFFEGTDDQYTEGINMEVCAPWIKKFPLSKLLLHPPLADKDVKYGVSIEQEGYTPSDLTSEVVPLGDRPFAATLYLNTFMITTDYDRGERVASTLSTGVIGPAAMGMQLQDMAHIIINDVQPPGWRYQVHNDVVLNYEWSYQRQFLSFGHVFSFDADAMARAGTLHDQVCPGLTAMLGNFDGPFTKEVRRKKIKFYIYDHPEVNFIGYDATLQGGLFDHSSPYTLSSDEVSHILFRNFAGVVLVNNRFSLQYYHCSQSRQFVGGYPHTWDGIQLATTIR